MAYRPLPHDSTARFPTSICDGLVTRHRQSLDKPNRNPAPGRHPHRHQWDAYRRRLATSALRRESKSPHKAPLAGDYRRRAARVKTPGLVPDN